MINIDKLYVYDNNELNLILIKNFAGTPLVIYEKVIDKFRISELENSSFVDELKTKIAKAESSILNIFGEKIKTVDTKLIFSPNKLILKEVEYRHRFEEPVLINEKNIRKIVKNGVKKEYLNNDLLVFDYSVIEFLLDNKSYKDYVQKEGKDILVRANLIITDSKTINQLVDVFSLLKIKFKEHYVIDYYLMGTLKRKNTGLIDLNYDINKIFYNVNGEVEESHLNTGLNIILQKIYELALKEYTKEQAEYIARFVKKNWLLEKFNSQYDIIEGIDINEVVELTQLVVKEYFSLLIPKLRDDLKINEIFINGDDVFTKELANYLSKEFECKVSSLLDVKPIVSTTISKKVAYCINSIYKEV